MNEYKITYSGESEGYRLVVDHTEAAAKKFFRELAKDLGMGRITIDGVELLRTDAPATKRNEMEALEVIRQMVADLGPDSYLATAFQGCFEIASQNIEFDFADSLQGRLELAEKKLRDEIAEKQKVRDEAQKTIKELEDKLTESQKDWEAAHAANHVLAEEKDAEIAALQAKTMSDEDLERVITILESQAEEAEAKVEKAAAEIVRFAEAPGLPEFTAAVSRHRNHTAYAKGLRELLGRVDAIRANNHAGA